MSRKHIVQNRTPVAHRQGDSQSKRNEHGAIFKDWGGRIRVALTMPNTYYVGMSSLALQLLYRIFNAEPDVVCERIFWEKGAVQAGRPLLSLESEASAVDFDVWAFTISWEMDYFNVVELLRQAGVPPLAADRALSRQWNGKPWPLLIAGGPGVTMNPEPMAPFFDAILIGEGEEAVPHFLELCRHGGLDEREALLAELDRTPGWYIPTLRPSNRNHPLFRKVERLWVRNLPDFDTSSALYTPDTEFANMHLMEIARGCGRGCRFCLAGYVYRPAREQPLEALLASAERALSLGYTKIGLVSAAVSDHTQIDELAVALQRMGASLSASSMRMDPISVPLIRALAETGAKTLTVAPEAGSQRLRNVINKTQTEEQMMRAISLAQEFNFPQLKLYFMVGHPTETDDDIQALIDFTLEARRRFKRRIAINATPFVPKAHTPFQWEAMTPVETLRRRQKMIHQALARHGIEVRADSPDWAEVQAVLSRGDRALAAVLLAIPSGGLTVKSFFQAMAAQGLEKAHYVGAWKIGSPLPWDVVQSGVSENYFHYELRLAGQNRTGLSCPPDSAGCMACQACDRAWAFRYGDNSLRPVPGAKGGPWRAEDWMPWTQLRTHAQSPKETPIDL
ncbi:MAG: radical SAM protein [Caldilinea sp.]|nr:radical SAM protein [Caldilinea sp.]MDW8440297.1 radical SAM protein [Caldilineaceae bacterium]